MDMRNSYDGEGLALVRKAMREILAMTGSPEGESAGEGVRFSGADPVFPTPYRIGTAGAAALGALGLAVSQLWQQRGGRAQRVSIDARAAAASLRSALYMRVDGQSPKGPWDPYSGFYPVKDGRWISIHCNFSNHRDAALRVLGNPADRAAAEKASASWDGLALENAIHEAKGCAGLARSAAEWATHPHSAAVAGQPLLEITRIGDAPPRPLPPAQRPLSNVRVLDLTRVLAGPTCARSLAEHGADVLKITGPHLPDSGLVEWDTGMGKRAAHLDLRDKAGTDTLRGLLGDADVFSQSYRPGALASKGFSPEEAAKLRPGIVYVTLSAWGTQGPWKDRRGFDSIVQTVSGMALAQSGAAKPKLLPVSAIDYIAGYLMATGAIAALSRRATEGGSWLVRVSLARTGKWIVDRGAEAAFAGVPAELPDEELGGLLAERETALGKLRYLKPVLGLSETPPYWERPPVALGTHPPAWT